MPLRVAPHGAGGLSVADILRLPHTVAVQLITGRTPEELYAAAAQAPILPAQPLDRSVHALASEQAAGRFGAAPTWLLGAGKELAQGLGSVATGGPFLGRDAYDLGDIAANEEGIRRALLALAMRRE